MSTALLSYCSIIFRLSRHDKIDAHNVNDKWGEHSEAFEKSLEPSNDEVTV